mgnify:FL=1
MERDSRGTLVFNDHPDFSPNLTPWEIFSNGSFGGTYWRPIFSSVIGEELKNQHLEFADWWEGIPPDMLTSSKYLKKINSYGVSCGTSLEMWESKGWIDPQDPYGWIQWYCRFFKGRRSPDDDRQIRRWNSFAGPKGRFRNQLINRIIAKNTTHDDFRVSPAIRQSLQHWAYRLTSHDFEDASVSKWMRSIGD